MFARYYYNLGCCCHTPVWFPARWISCCCVFPFHQAHSTGNVDHSTELHPWQAELQPAGMEDLISIDSSISFILEEGSFVSQTNSCKPLCSPSALCLHRDARDLHVGRGLEGFGAGSCGLSMQRPDLGQKTRSAWCWGNALFGPKQVPFESEPPDGLCCRMGYFCNHAPGNTCRRGSAGTWQLHAACLPCSPCLSVCIQTWAPGMWAQAETKRRGCVRCVALDWTFLPCSMASCLRASCPSPFQGLSDASAMPWPFPSMGILLIVRLKSGKEDFHLPQVLEVVCSVWWQK